MKSELEHSQLLKYICFQFVHIDLFSRVKEVFDGEFLTEALRSIDSFFRTYVRTYVISSQVFVPSFCPKFLSQVFWPYTMPWSIQENDGHYTRGVSDTVQGGRTLYRGDGHYIHSFFFIRKEFIRNRG